MNALNHVNLDQNSCTCERENQFLKMQINLTETYMNFGIGFNCS